MKHPLYTVSNDTLRYDIKTKKRLSNSTFSMSGYMKQEQLEKNSDRIIESFIEGHLSLEKNQYKLFAKYINIFARHHSDECYKKLQDLADFDVKEYLKESEKTLWQKLFESKPKAPAAKTHRQMKKEMKRYVKACRKGDEFKAHDIREGAEMYVASFLNNEFPIAYEDERIFKNYIKTILYPVYAESNAEKALAKIRSHNYRVAEVQKPSLMERASAKAESVFGGIQRFFSDVAEKIVKPIGKFKMPSFAVSENHKRTASRVFKIAGLAGLLTVGTIWGAKNCSGSDKDTFAQNKTELTETPQDSIAKKDSTTYHFAPVSKLSKVEDFKPTILNTETKAENNSVQTEISAEKQAVHDARINHHRFILKKRIGTKRMKAMYANVNKKIGKGIFSLPDSLGTDDFVYALVMYRAHGVESSLQDAFNATDKLSAAENAEIIKDILDAGDTGLGVKKKAEQIRLAQNKGPLEEGYSLYNQLSQKDQHRHNVNLKQYRQAKKMLANSLAR